MRDEGYDQNGEQDDGDGPISPEERALCQDTFFAPRAQPQASGEDFVSPDGLTVDIVLSTRLFEDEQSWRNITYTVDAVRAHLCDQTSGGYALRVREGEALVAVQKISDNVHQSCINSHTVPYRDDVLKFWSGAKLIVDLAKKVAANFKARSNAATSVNFEVSNVKSQGIVFPSKEIPERIRIETEQVQDWVVKLLKDVFERIVDGEKF